MTYARARLWLGISGVGSLVIIATMAIVFDLPGKYLSHDPVVGLSALIQLATLTGLFVVWLLPFDFLGGFLLPTKFEKTNLSFGTWFSKFVPAAIGQAALFVVFGCLILWSNRLGGTPAVALAISLGVAISVTVRNRMLLNRESNSQATGARVLEAIATIQSWQIFVPKTIVVDHDDPGFTGGIVGFGKNAQIVIPKAWLSFSRDQLATAIARRAVAINSGSYSRGLLLAFAWNAFGFLLCSSVANAGLDSVAGLATTACWFTLWSFLGLLTLPSVSRNASLKIDQILVQQGMPDAFVKSTASAMDSLQDGEPERPTLIETIFHPVPSVAKRNPVEPVRGLAAWNVARTSLFFSWACLGFLARCVHCNVGRPELWTMLPTD